MFGFKKILLKDFKLGIEYFPKYTVFAVWAPNHHQVVLNLNGRKIRMKKTDSIRYPYSHGEIFFVKVRGNHELKKYQFIIDQKISRDPYGVMVEPQTNWNIILDLKHPDTLPGEDWVPAPPLEKREDTVLYEVHVRDFTISEDSGVSPNLKGKFGGMIQTETKNTDGYNTGIDHLKELGITHVQLLPVYDFATPLYNWGYDPENYNIPEEHYSVDPTNYRLRVKEFRNLVNEFHRHGIRVIMDVVYNHTYSNEAFENITPRYYTGLNLSGCGNSLNTAEPMVSRFIRDSLEFWINEYHIDGFRFDLIGIFHYKEVNKWGEYLNYRYPDRKLLLYGEPWNGYSAELSEGEKIRLGKVPALASGRVGVFNPKYREAVKGDNDGTGKGFIFNAGSHAMSITQGMRGSILHTKQSHPLTNDWDPMFAYDPEQTINYISAHDNYCLWDKIVLSLADEVKKEDWKVIGVTFNHENRPYAERIDRFGTGIILTSQGIPFLHAGDEFLRTKVFKDDWQYAHNSYNAPDEYNQIKWKLKTENIAIFHYYKDLIALRKNHPALRLATWDDINYYMHTKIQNPSFVFSYIPYPEDELLVVYNAGETTPLSLQNFNIPTDHWVLIADHRGAVYEPTTEFVCEGTAVTIFQRIIT